MSKPLKLRAISPEDLTIVSALMQDAAVRVGDMGWQKADRRFAVVGSRYVHERRRWFRKPKGERVLTGLHFNDVVSVIQTEIDLSDKDHVLGLLAIRSEAMDNGNTAVQLDFSGTASIRLEVETIDLVVSDMSEPWDAIARPRHPDSAPNSIKD